MAHEYVVFLYLGQPKQNTQAEARALLLITLKRRIYYNDRIRKALAMLVRSDAHSEAIKTGIDQSMQGAPLPEYMQFAVTGETMEDVEKASLRI